ncbi:Protein CBG17555 [Caenorhabditis briggsae]|uniref:Protein CBG17555 n=1 Tax=Caenorhabditis briggsae TaxID=6238 RepID=A8XR84_CAEBR|nr:Protein CBG17555 [Caenorhabditis briggsae]CAP35181.1 Protein CBG17555 [Caenorhabditis briggsae]
MSILESRLLFSFSLSDLIYRTLCLDPEVLDFQLSNICVEQNLTMNNWGEKYQSGLPGPRPTERENWTAADFFVMTPAAPLHNAQETGWPSPISTEPAGCSGMQSWPNDAIRSRRSVQDYQYIPIPLQSMPNRTFDGINSYGAAIKHEIVSFSCFSGAVSSNYDLDSIQPSSFYLGAAYEALLENVLSPSYQPPNAENMSYGHTVNGNNLFAEHHSPQRGSNNPLQPPIAMSTSSSMPSKNTVADVVHSCRCSEASNDEHLQQALQIMRRPNPMNTNIKQIILELFKTLGNLGMEKFSSRLLEIPYVAFRFEMKLDMPFECYHNREDIVRVIFNFSQLPRCMRNQLLRQSNCISVSFQQTQSNKQRLMDNWGSKYQSGLLGPCPTDRQDWTAADFFVMAPAGPLLYIQETSWPSPVSTVPSNIDDQDGPKPSSFYLGEAHDTLFGDFLSQVSNRTDNIIAFGPSQTLMGTPETSSTPPKHLNHDCPYSETTDDEHLQEARRLMDTRASKYTKIKKFGSRLQKILGNDEMATFSSQILEIPIEAFQKQMALDTPFKCYNDRQNILQLVTNFSKLPTCMRNQLLRQANPITASCKEASGSSLKEVWFGMKRFPKQKRMDTVNEVLSAGSVIYKNSEEMLIKALATTPHE